MFENIASLSTTTKVLGAAAILATAATIVSAVKDHKEIVECCECCETLEEGCELADPTV